MNVDFSGARWFKSTKSANKDCVEAAFVEGMVGVRDSKNVERGHLAFSSTAWGAFVSGIASGEFDRP